MLGIPLAPPEIPSSFYCASRSHVAHVASPRNPCYCPSATPWGSFLLFPRSQARHDSRPLGTNFETNVFEFWWSSGPIDQIELYHSPNLSKIRDLGDRFFCGGSLWEHEEVKKTIGSILQQFTSGCGSYRTGNFATNRLKNCHKQYDSLSDVGENRVYFASKKKTRVAMEFREKGKFFVNRSVPENFQWENFLGQVPTESLRTQDSENVFLTLFCLPEVGRCRKAKAV